MSSPRHAAHWYARRGFHVFACVARGKVPATAHGCSDATDATDAIDRMWSADPDFNVAIACGPSAVCVVDVDGEAGAASLARLVGAHGALPPTPTVTTARGLHFYFADPDGVIRNSASKLGEGIDTRGVGGYVLAPPSVHPSGAVYRWALRRGLHEVDLAPLPSWIVAGLAPCELARNPQPVAVDTSRINGYARRALVDECASVSGAPEGTRNHALNRAAFNVGQLVGAGALDRRLALGALIQSGQRAGLSARECLLTVNSGVPAGEAQPRRLSA